MGCATIKLDVELYKGEIPEKQLNNIAAGIDALSYAIEGYRVDRDFIDDKIVELYLEWVKAFSGRPASEEEIFEYETQKASYHSKLLDRVSRTLTQLDSIKAELCYSQNNYSNKDKITVDCSNSKIIGSIIIIASKLDLPFEDDPFQDYFITGWPDRIFEAQSIADSTKVNIDTVEVNLSLLRMISILDEIRQKAPSYAEEIWSIRKDLNADNLASFYGLVNLSLSSDKVYTPKDYAQHLLYNDIITNKSLAGSVAWKEIIYQSDSTKAWKRVFGKTFWKASGNSEVVIVKDSPVDFRVKQGRNDPRNIIATQMIVSRSVGDLGMALAGFKLNSTGSITVEEEGEIAESGKFQMLRTYSKQSLEKMKIDLENLAQDGISVSDTVLFKQRLLSLMDLYIRKSEEILKIY